MKSIPVKPSDIILEARRILDKRIKTLLLFFGLNMVCLSVSFTNKPHLWFWFLVVGCYLVYEWQKKQKDFQKAKSLKFDSVSELEKDLNMEVTNDEWENIKKLNEKLKMFFNVENVSIIFLLVSYLIVGMRVTLSLIDNHGVLK
ncbi:RipA family octameric membrane protein [Helicobacter pylori]